MSGRRTSSGKIERKRLPSAEAAAVDLAAVVPPRSEAEALVRDAFASVLGVAADTISVEASFFELGGNSLKAVLLGRRLAEVLGWAVGAADVMQRPTVAALAAGQDDAAEGLRLPPLTRAVDAAALGASPHPVSWNQSQLLTVHLSGGAEAAYSIPVGFWLTGQLDVCAFRGALSALIERHAVLRTTFEVGADGSFVQRVRVVPEGDALLRELEAPGVAAAEALAAADAGRGFELLGEGGSVMRSTLVRAEADRHLLLLIVHHVAFDGESTGILLSELGAVYRSLSAGGSVADAALRELPAQYVDYALWQRAESLAPLLEGSREYWRTQLREGALPCSSCQSTCGAPLSRRLTAAACRCRCPPRWRRSWRRWGAHTAARCTR